MSAFGSSERILGKRSLPKRAAVATLPRSDANAETELSLARVGPPMVLKA